MLRRGRDDHEDMSGFQAVVTTGIYCRPGCAGRPKPENIRMFTTAAAAEAKGYRACLRCRPYREEPVGPPGSELVCRAVRLVVDGALDARGESELAARLGISSRHLRRLFADTLGITPDQLARSCRAHFARRLLDDTDMTILDVAFASGYGSVRQLNRAFREIFRATPTALRARRRSGDRLVADGGVVLRLGDAPPPDYSAMLEQVAERAIPGVESVSGATYRRTIAVDNHPGVLEISPGGDGRLLLRAHLPDLRGLIHQVRRAGRIFDPQPGQDLRTPGAWDDYETAVCALIARHTSHARAVIGRIVARAGTPIPGLHHFGLSHLFPAPEVLAEADLSGLGLTTETACTVRSFAHTIATDRRTSPTVGN
ncbi:bifunctional transcriptional activator/DNA repair enzyme AdaA [Nocardia terpenica]|nr:helix-turn-helix domain-containing protein [Nocardia terpenica]